MDTVPHFFFAKKGQLLYHYTSVEAALAILENQSLWMSDFKRMNDTKEYSFAKAQYLEAYHNREVYIEEYPRFLNTINLISLENNTVMFIGCLTREPNDPSHWKNYANNSSGCAVGISAEFLEDWAGTNISSVVYDKSAMKSFFHAGWLMLQEQYEKEPDNQEELDTLSKFFLSDLYAFKRPEYQNEKEVRISRLLVKNSKKPIKNKDVGGFDKLDNKLPAIPVKTRKGQFGKTEYIELPLKSKLGGNGIREIRLGENCSQEARDAILNKINDQALEIELIG